jgi:hypothetical protein
MNISRYVNIDKFVNYIYPELNIQGNLSNPTHQGNREMCRIEWDDGILRFDFNLQYAKGGKIGEYSSL